DVFDGMATVGKVTRRPVSVVASATVKKSLGNGYRQTLESRKSHGQVSTVHGQVQSPPQVDVPPHEEPGGSHSSPFWTAPSPHTGTVVVVVLDVVVLVVDVVVDVVVVVGVGQRPVTAPEPSVVSCCPTHSLSMSVSMAFVWPSPVQPVTLSNDLPKFAAALARQPPGALSTGTSFLAAFE